MTENCTCTQIQFTVKTGIFPEVFPFQCNASLQNVGPQTISYERGQVQFIHLKKEVIPGSLTGVQIRLQTKRSCQGFSEEICRKIFGRSEERRVGKESRTRRWYGDRNNKRA